MKRFKAYHQDSLGLIWNVIDRKTNIFIKHCLTGRDAEKIAKKKARQLNADKRYKHE